MDLEWEAKDAENRRKHGVSLADAARLDWKRGLPGRDERRDYGEERRWIIAPLDGRLHVCVYTLRADRTRIISLKANPRERRKYAAFIAPTRG